MIETLGLQLLIIPSLTTFFLFITNGFFHLPITRLLLLGGLFISWLICRLCFRSPKNQHDPSGRLTGLEIVLLIGLLSLLSLNYLFNWYWPPVEFDALSMYDFRGRIFFLNHNIQDINNGYHASYPLFTSLAHTAMYLMGFANPKLFYSLMLTGSLLVFYTLLRRHHSRPASLIGLFLFLSTPAIFYHSQIAYTNFVYTCFLGLALIYLCELLASTTRHDLIIFSLLMASASWTRPATHPYFIINLLPLIYLSFIKRRPLFVLLPIFTYLSFSLPWTIYQSTVLRVGTYESSALSKVTVILPNLLPYLQEVFIALKVNFTSRAYSGGTGLLFLVATFSQGLLSIKQLFHSPFLVLGLNLVVWIALSLLIQIEFNTHTIWLQMLYDTMQRLFIIYFPLIIATTLSYPIIQSLIKKTEQILR